MVIMAKNSDISEKQIIHLWESLTALPQTISLLAPEPVFLTYHKTRTWLSGFPVSTSIKVDTRIREKSSLLY